MQSSQAALTQPRWWEHTAEMSGSSSPSWGEQVQSTLFSVEYESPDAMGEAFDAMGTDPELHRVRTQAAGSTQTSETMGIELPTSHTSTPGRGSILELHISTVKPGRMAEVPDDSADAARSSRRTVGSTPGSCNSPTRACQAA